MGAQWRPEKHWRSSEPSSSSLVHEARESLESNRFLIPCTRPCAGQFGMENTWYDGYDASEQYLDWWCNGQCDQYSRDAWYDSDGPVVVVVLDAFQPLNNYWYYGHPAR